MTTRELLTEDGVPERMGFYTPVHVLEFAASGGLDTSDHSLETHVPVAPALDDTAVRDQLGRLLGSGHFRTSKRCQALLRFVVEAYLENHTDRVKERTIGIEVFQRDPDYDTNQDSVVRTTAAEIRKKLAQYYLEPGHDNELRVLLPQGSYLPEFRPPPVAAAAPAPPAEKAPAAADAMRQRLIGVAAALALVAVAGLAGYWYSRPRTTELSLFWKPLLEDASGAVICVGQPLRVYIFEGSRTADLNEKMVGTLDLAAGQSGGAAEDLREPFGITAGGRPVLHRGRLSGVGPAGRVPGTARQTIPGDRRPQHGV